MSVYLDTWIDDPGSPFAHIVRRRVGPCYKCGPHTVLVTIKRQGARERMGCEHCGAVQPLRFSVLAQKEQRGERRYVRSLRNERAAKAILEFRAHFLWLAKMAHDRALRAAQEKT